MALSKWANSVSGYIPKDAFVNIPSTEIPSDADIDSFIRLYIFDSIPNFIIEKPVIFDKIRQTIASMLEINNTDVKITGSAKLGFSLSPDKWLNEYCPGSSDLDFFIISEELYERLLRDINIWRNDIRNEEIVNFELVENNSKGPKYFIDTWYIPRRYSNTNKCFNAMNRACLNINNMFGENIIDTQKGGKYASIRCYKNYDAAIKRIRFNISDALKKTRATLT